MNASREELEKVKAQLEELLRWVNSKLEYDSHIPPQTKPLSQQPAASQPTVDTLSEPQPRSTNPATHSSDTRLQNEDPTSGIAVQERTGCIIAAIAFSALVIGTIFFLPNCIYQ